jgi:hypothetical protein
VTSLQEVLGLPVSARRKRRHQRRPRQHRGETKGTWAPPGELQEADETSRLAYGRKQAAQALGVSISTIDRRVVQSISTVQTPRGKADPRPRTRAISLTSTSNHLDQLACVVPPDDLRPCRSLSSTVSGSNTRVAEAPRIRDGW